MSAWPYLTSVSVPVFCCGCFCSVLAPTCGTDACATFVSPPTRFHLQLEARIQPWDDGEGPPVPHATNAAATDEDFGGHWRMPRVRTVRNCFSFVSLGRTTDLGVSVLVNAGGKMRQPTAGPGRFMFHCSAGFLNQFPVVSVPSRT